MFTYQIVALIISLVAIIIGIRQYKNESFNLLIFLSWDIIWIGVIIITFYPNITTHIAHTFGLGRGLDALYIIYVIFSFYVMFKLYNKIEKQNKRINDLVSKLAIKEHEDDD